MGGATSPVSPLHIGPNTTHSSPAATLLTLSATGAVHATNFTSRISFNVNNDNDFGPFATTILSADDLIEALPDRRLGRRAGEA
jgi:hypothetical protein